MQLMVKSYVMNELFQQSDPSDRPDPCRRRYFPTMTDIRNIMTKTRSENTHAKVIDYHILLVKYYNFSYLSL